MPQKPYPSSLIDSRGYSIAKEDLSEEIEEEIKSELEIVKKAFVGNGTIIKAYSETDTRLILPRYFGQDTFGKPVKNNLDNYLEPAEMEFTASLWPNQQKAANKTLAHLQRYGGGILTAECGAGKTNMALWLACQLGVKTLFLAHSDFLLDQAEARLLSCTTEQQAGRISATKFEIDSNFVIGSIPSLVKERFTRKMLRGFGLVIIDEAHHMAADGWSTLFRKIGYKYTLGITAETSRSDGTFSIIEWNIGKIICHVKRPPLDKAYPVLVKQIYLHLSDKHKIPNKKLYNGRANISAIVTAQAENQVCTKFIVRIIRVLAQLGRRTIALSERLSQVHQLFELLENSDTTTGNVGICVGGMKTHEQQEAFQKQSIVGVYQKAQEGLDIPELDTVIFCSSKVSIRQPIGRALRVKKTPVSPIIIDLVCCDTDVLVSQAEKRVSYYRRENFQVKQYHFARGDANYESTGSNTAIAEMILDGLTLVD